MPEVRTDLFEVVLTLAMFVGLATSLANWSWARARLRELIDRGENGVLLILRRGAAHDQALLCWVWLCLVIVLCIALFLPEQQPPKSALEDARGLALLTMFIVLEWLTFGIRRRPGQLRDALAVTATSEQ